jgi:creatinine amidohydrolase
VKRRRAMYRDLSPLTLIAGVLIGSTLMLSGQNYTPPAIGPGSLYIENMTWTEVRDAQKAGKTTVIVPTGGTEQSGPHMVLGKESFAVFYNAGEIARRLGNALVAPTLAYVPEGRVDPPAGHMRFPGSITLPDEAYIPVLLWAGRSFKATGFTDIAFIGNSGGNQDGMKAAADQLNKEWAGTNVRAHFINDYYYTTAPYPGHAYDSPYDLWLLQHGEKKEDIGNHAGIRDTSTLMAVEAMHFTKGALVRWDKIVPTFDGVSGNPTRASVEYGKQGLEMKIAASVKEIQALTARK